MQKNSIKERFLSKVDASDVSGCWVWTGCKAKKGFPYGKLRSNKKGYLAHRFAWELYLGQIPEGKMVLHKCDNPPCVRPDHLFLGSQQDNMKDSNKKKRMRWHKQTHCKKGHPLSGDNLYIPPGGTDRRICLTCRREYDKKLKRKIREKDPEKYRVYMQDYFKNIS